MLGRCTRLGRHETGQRYLAFLALGNGKGDEAGYLTTSSVDVGSEST